MQVAQPKKRAPAVTAEAEEVRGRLILTPVSIAVRYVSFLASLLLWAGIVCRFCSDGSVKSRSQFPFLLCLLPLGSLLCRGIGVLAEGQELVPFLCCRPACGESSPAQTAAIPSRDVRDGAETCLCFLLWQKAPEGVSQRGKRHQTCRTWPGICLPVSVWGKKERSLQGRRFPSAEVDRGLVCPDPFLLWDPARK